MSRLLFVVEDSFLIKGRGLVPVPGIIPQGEERFRIGDPILFKRPDGSVLRWDIGGIEIFNFVKPFSDPPLGILLKGLDKDALPIGSEAWSVDRAGLD